MRLLLLEHDPDLRRLLDDAFKKERFLVDASPDGCRAAEQVTSQDYDLVVLDLDLPTCDGLDVCRRIRDAQLDVPIMVVSELGASDERARALDAGADDCVVKPIRIRETMAHARALLRRGRTRHLTSVLAYGPLTLDPYDHIITLDGVPLALSSTEYRLLRFLMRRAETIVSREQLIQHVWGGTLDTRSNTPDVYLSYLRQKLAPSGRRLIHTVRGLGYVLRLTPPASFACGTRATTAIEERS
jgi:two-component system response regulator MprA